MKLRTLFIIAFCGVGLLVYTDIQENKVQEAYLEGELSGYSRGFNDGQSFVNASTFYHGRDEGYADGYDVASIVAFSRGFEAGNSSGYFRGYTDAINLLNNTRTG